MSNGEKWKDKIHLSVNYHYLPLTPVNSYTSPLYLEIKISFGIIITYVFYHLVDALCLVASVWDDAILDVIAHEVAEDASEVLMTWI